MTTDNDDLIEIRSPYRPFPRTAKRKLDEEFDAEAWLDGDSTGRNEGVLVPERPPEDFLAKWELEVVRDPDVAYETPSGLVEIYTDPDQVIIDGQEATMTPVDAVEQAEASERFTLVEGDPDAVRAEADHGQEAVADQSSGQTQNRGRGRGQSRERDQDQQHGDDPPVVSDGGLPTDLPHTLGEFELDTEYSDPEDVSWYAYKSGQPDTLAATHRIESPWHKVRIIHNSETGFWRVRVWYRNRYGGLRSNPRVVLHGATREAALAFATAYMETFDSDDYGDGRLLDDRPTWQAGRDAAEEEMGDLAVAGISQLYPPEWNTDDTGAPVPPAASV